MEIRQWLLASMALIAGSVAISISAQADTLPEDYQGNWYGYISSEKVHQQRHYYVGQVTLTGDQVAYDYFYTGNKQLKKLQWKWGASALATYKAKTDKQNRQNYRIYTPVYSDEVLARVRLTVTKVNGKKIQALVLHTDDEDLYLFKKPTRSHAWGFEHEDELYIYY